LGRGDGRRPADRPYGRAARLRAVARHVLVTQCVMNLAILVLTLAVLLVALALGAAAGGWATFLLGLPMVFGLKLLMASVNTRYGLYSDESWGIEIALGAVVFLTLFYMPGLLGHLVHGYRAAEIQLSRPQELARLPRQAAFYRLQDSTALEALRGQYTVSARKSRSRTYEVRPLVEPEADPQRTLEHYRAARQCAWVAYEHDATWFAGPVLPFWDRSPTFVEIDPGKYRWAAAAALKLQPDQAPGCARFYNRTPARDETVAQLWLRAATLLLLVNLAPWVFFLWVLGHVLKRDKAS